MSVKPKLPAMKGGSSEGQLKTAAKEKFAEPSTDFSDHIGEFSGQKNDIGEKSGFQTTGYLTKKGTPYGEAAKLNKMPPGMDISDQEVADIRTLPMKEIVDTSYPGDGWE